MRTISQEVRDKIINGTSAERRYICEKLFLAFCVYYFPHYFTYKLASFHYDFVEDCEKLASGDSKEVVWVGFKECAKTSYAKMFILWLICYKKKRYINIDSADGKNAGNIAFETALELQTNKRIIGDFGQLFTEQRTDEEKKMKKVTSFITANDIKVEAFSTGQPTRGRLFKNNRPDAYILDDYENSNTILSVPITQKIISHINELRSGLSKDGIVLYLGNYITDTGVVQFTLDTVQRSGGITRFIPVSKEKKPLWLDKYEMTDQEAIEVNKGRQKECQKVSLESKKRELGGTVFETEMMLNPLASGDLIFNRAKINKLLEADEQEYEESAGFRTWESFNPRHRYAIGADTAKGIGGDSNASVLIDFSTVPNAQVGSFASNTITPDLFAHELKRQGNMFGECLIAPENNGTTGGTTINELKGIYQIDKIFRPRGIKTGVSAVALPQNTLGFETNGATKHDIIFQLKSAVEDGILKINDKRILEEMKFYARKELQQLTPSPLATKHFDLLISCAISWAMREYAEVKEEVFYEQPAYEPSSEYETTQTTSFKDNFYPLQ